MADRPHGLTFDECDYSQLGLNSCDGCKERADAELTALRARVAELEAEVNAGCAERAEHARVVRERDEARRQAADDREALMAEIDSARRAGKAEGKAEAFKEISDALLKRGAIEVTAGHRVAAGVLTEMAGALLASAEEVQRG